MDAEGVEVEGGEVGLKGANVGVKLGPDEGRADGLDDGCEEGCNEGAVVGLKLGAAVASISSGPEESRRSTVDQNFSGERNFMDVQLVKYRQSLVRFFPMAL